MPRGGGNKEKTEKFIRLVFEARMSHVDAYLNAGYSPNDGSKRATALRAATRKLKQPYVIKRLQDLQKRADDAAVMSVIERKIILSEIGRAKISDFVDKDGQVTIRATSAIAEVVIDSLSDKKIKLRDPVAAIQELNKMCGDYPVQKHELTGKDGGPIEMEIDAKAKLFGLIVNGAARIRNQDEGEQSLPAGSPQNTVRLDSVGPSESTTP